MKQTSIEAYRVSDTTVKIITEKSKILNAFYKNPNTQMDAYEVANKSGLNYFIVQKRIKLLVENNSIEIVGVKKVGKYSRTLYQLCDEGKDTNT